MNISDPISDMLTRIRNANMAFHDEVSIPYSKAKEAIAVILRDEGYIDAFEVVEDPPGSALKVTLRYGRDRSRSIKGLKRISKPGLRVYVPTGQLPKVLGGMGTAIISTSSGMMTDKKARRRKLGGEVVAHIW